MKETSLSFCSFDSTWQSMVSLAKGTTNGVSRLCALLVQQVSHAWRVAQVSRGCIFYCFFASSSLHVLLLFSTFLSWEIWGMNMPNLPEVSCLEDFLVVVFVALASRRLMLLWQWLLSRDEYHSDTHDVLTTPLLGLLARLPCGSEADCHGSPCCVRGALVSRALLRITMMVLIASMAINDGFDCAHCKWRCCCHLLPLVVTVPSSNACIVFTARIFNSLITIQTELSLY